jgi:hypothetical protein
MLYTRPKFTCPASHNTDQIRWDYAFLSQTAFQKKYLISERAYDELGRRGELGIVTLATL